jgi:hypothetical protein
VRLHHYLFASLPFELCFIILFLIGASWARVNVGIMALIICTFVILGLKGAYIFSHYTAGKGMNDLIVYFLDLLGGINYILYVAGFIIMYDIVWYERDYHDITSSVVTIYYIMLAMFIFITLFHLIIRYACYSRYTEVINIGFLKLTQNIDEEENKPLMEAEPNKSFGVFVST